ncbi:MAG TPA: hypothetical protein VG148_13470 [Pyrinomonadaceae bacterium]|nr:hypothetical protein [Pyrinomonadaceae bacterium]
MKDQHIIGILEGGPLARLSEGELAAARAHAEGCAECRRAFDAARVSAALLRERAAERVEPSPFFQTRVLAALRERLAEEETPSLRRLWRAAGALVSSMAAAVALLAVFTFVAPNLGLAPADDGQVAATAPDYYSTDAALFGPAETADAEVDYDQVFRAVYASAESEDVNE